MVRTWHEHRFQRLFEIELCIHILLTIRATNLKQARILTLTNLAVKSFNSEKVSLINIENVKKKYLIKYMLLYLKDRQQVITAVLPWSH